MKNISLGISVSLSTTRSYFLKKAQNLKFHHKKPVTWNKNNQFSIVYVVGLWYFSFDILSVPIYSNRENENRNHSLDTWSWSNLSMEQTSRITLQRILKSIQILFNFITPTTHAPHNFTNNKIACVFFIAGDPANICLIRPAIETPEKCLKYA